MSTRATVLVFDSEYKCVLNLYSHYDGYPNNGLGQRIHDFMLNRRVVNGFQGTDNWQIVSNGFDNLAAQLVWYLMDKSPTKIGAYYIYPIPEEKFEFPTIEAMKSHSLPQIFRPYRYGTEWVYAIYKAENVQETPYDSLCQLDWNRRVNIACFGHGTGFIGHPAQMGSFLVANEHEA